MPASGAGMSIGTDEDGRFRADDLAPGMYSVFAYAAGYVTEADPVERQTYRPGDVVTLRMIKGGVISGTVTNSSGEPVIAARVSASRVRDAEQRPIRGASPTNSRQTDDLGAFRIYGLQSGSYVVAVNGGTAYYYSSSPGGYDADAPTYYPSTTRDAAVEITVRAGEEVNGIDIKYRGERGHTVSGTLSGVIGKNPSRGVSVTLAYPTSGAIESSAYLSLRAGERGFALYGVPDGEYEIVARGNTGAENDFASAPRRVVVKGADVTGIELTLAPLGSISGRILVEPLLDSERKDACKTKSGALLEETVMIARRDERANAKEQSSSGDPSYIEGAADDKGEFKIYGLGAGRYRIEPRLPESWYVRSIMLSATQKQPDLASTGLALSSGQRVTDLTVTLAEGAAGLRGKVVPASENTSVPPRFRVHLVPAEAESADDVLRYAEAAVGGDGVFSITNLAPGRYLLLARAVTDDEFMVRTPRLVAWDATARTKLQRDAKAVNVVVELHRCQRLTDYVLKYQTPPDAKKRPPKTNP
jgi:hypothetical protein